MTPKERESCWQKLCKLWPSWKTTSALYDAWMTRLAELNYRATVTAIDDHWEEHSKAFSPDPAAIVKLANRMTFEVETPEQAQRRQWFYGLNRLMQARELREHYARMAKKYEGEQQQRYETMEIVASAQAARLYVLHGEHCPPNFGANTSRGAAPGTLFRQVSATQIMENKQCSP